MNPVLDVNITVQSLLMHCLLSGAGGLEETNEDVQKLLAVHHPLPAVKHFPGQDRQLPLQPASPA